LGAACVQSRIGKQMQNDDDNGGRKPYKRYKAGRARRSSVDDELAGARPAREPRTSDASRAADDPPEYTARSNGEYRRYTPVPAERGSGKTKTAPGRRRFRWWFVPVGLLITVVIAAVVVTVLAWPGYKKFDRAVSQSNRRLDKKARAQLTPDAGWIWRNGTTLLLFGVDATAGEPGRSDTIMLMRFNPKTHSINQLSIPRDTRVQLPNGNYDKINTAMFWGGPAMAMQVVKKYLGIDVNHVMVVDFKGFPRLVNAVGGVDMNVPKTISTVAGGHGRIVVFKKGMHHFDGKYAMLYVRIRYADDDFHRAARQQQFVQALQKKVVRPSNITKLPEIGKRFMSGVATDLTTNQILELAYLKWRATGGTKAVMVGAPALIGGVSYVLPPPDAEKQKMVHTFLTK
jgi:LCP family protein required for cell wall assembly